MTLRPMLAALVKPEHLALLRYPLIVQPKYDGIRCLITEEGAVSRKLKHIPNQYIQKLLCTSRELIGLDGELIAGETYNKTSSAVMSRDGTPVFTYYVFDHWNKEGPYLQRMLEVQGILERTKMWFIKITPAAVANNADDVHLALLDTAMLYSMFDGVILRDPNAGYKFGRSTLRQQWLLKYKSFEDAEATVIGFECMMHNDNPEEKDNLGYTKRSHKQEGKTPSEYLGTLRVRNAAGIEFNIGTGFTQSDRFFLWKIRDHLLGKTVTYKYQGGGGYEAPRFPSFKGFREDV